MNRKNSPLLISAGFLIALVLILTAKGWNDNKQILDTSAEESATPTPSTDHEGHNHTTPQQVLLDIYSAEDSTAKSALVDRMLSGNGSNADFEEYLSDCSENTDPKLVTYCKLNIAANTKNWTEFSQHLFSLTGDHVEDEFILQVLEPLLVKANEAEAKPLYYNLLSDIYLHDPNNTQRFMTGIRSLRKVLDLDSNNEQAIYKLAVFSVRSNQLEKAKLRFKKLISLQPENEGYRKMLEELCIQTGDSTCFD